MSEKKLVIFGAGDIAELAKYYFDTDSEYQVVAYTVDREFVDSDSKDGIPVVPFDEVEERFSPDEHTMFVALSYNQINQLRASKVREAKDKGYSLASYISSRATVLTEKPVGENCFILEDNTIQPFVTIGENVTLWSGNHIGHHSEVQDHCFIASHVVVSGGVKIEPYCFLGVNVTLRDHITIGASSVLGAGVLLLGDAEPNSVYMGKATEKSRIPSNRLRGI